MREAQVLGGLAHPNILPVYDIGEDPDAGLFYMMPLIAQPTLEEALTALRDGKISHGRILRLFIQECQAIAYAHSRGVVHCDLKPPNMLLGSFGEVFVADWGFAYREGDPKRVRGGTPGYMPPEQLQRGGKIGPQTDVLRARRHPLSAADRQAALPVRLVRRLGRRAPQGMRAGVQEGAPAQQAREEPQRATGAGRGVHARPRARPGQPAVDRVGAGDRARVVPGGDQGASPSTEARGRAHRAGRRAARQLRRPARRPGSARARADRAALARGTVGLGRGHEKYAGFVEDMIARTDSPPAPWTIVEASDRYYMRIKVFETIIAALAARLGLPSSSEKKSKRPRVTREMKGAVNA